MSPSSATIRFVTNIRSFTPGALLACQLGPNWHKGEYSPERYDISELEVVHYRCPAIDQNDIIMQHRFIGIEGRLGRWFSESVLPRGH